jgi:uncharacterized protein YjbJ (UPF0337 family)
MRAAIGERPIHRAAAFLQRSPLLQGAMHRLAFSVARLRRKSLFGKTFARWHGRCGRRGHRAPRGARQIRSRGIDMNWDRIEGNWKQFKGRVKEQWGKLTDDDIDVIAGRRDQLVGKIQQQYGISKDEAEQQVDRFGKSFRDEDLRTYQ